MPRPLYPERGEVDLSRPAGCPARHGDRVATSRDRSPHRVPICHDRMHTAGAYAAGDSSPFWQISSTDGRDPMAWSGMDVSQDALDVPCWTASGCGAGTSRTRRHPDRGAGPVGGAGPGAHLRRSHRRRSCPLLAVLLTAWLPTSLVHSAPVVACRQTLLVHPGGAGGWAARGRRRADLSAQWGRGQPQPAAACAGLQPRQACSGRRQQAWHSRTGTGPARLRRSLSMAALVAIQRDATIRAYDDGLVGRGKATLVAVVAVMHKLLRQMMGRLRTYYQQQPEAAPA